MDGLVAVADAFGLVLVEDAAESLGSLYGERHTGTLGLCGALSFNGNKIITTGGGGAVLTMIPSRGKGASSDNDRATRCGVGSSSTMKLGSTTACRT